MGDSSWILGLGSLAGIETQRDRVGAGAVAVHPEHASETLHGIFRLAQVEPLASADRA